VQKVGGVPEQLVRPVDGQARHDERGPLFVYARYMTGIKVMPKEKLEDLGLM